MRMRQNSSLIRIHKGSMDDDVVWFFINKIVNHLEKGIRNLVLNTAAVSRSSHSYLLSIYAEEQFFRHRIWLPGYVVFVSRSKQQLTSNKRCCC
jgi:hypothetical protein